MAFCFYNYRITTSCSCSPALLLQKLGYHIFLVQQQGHLLVLGHEPPYSAPAKQGRGRAPSRCSFFCWWICGPISRGRGWRRGGLIELDVLGGGVGFLCMRGGVPPICGWCLCAARWNTPFLGTKANILTSNEFILKIFLIHISLPVHSHVTLSSISHSGSQYPHQHSRPRFWRAGLCDRRTRGASL